jgi:predicted lipid-binding transport protein (Tim44 family)
MRPIAALVLTVLVASHSRLLAQQATSPEPATPASDSVLVAARDMGLKAADRSSVDGYFLGGLAGGLVLGFYSAVYPFVDRATPGLKRSIGAGLLTISGAAVLGARSPVEMTATVSEELRARSPEEQETFRQSYAQHLRQRRRDAALMGGATGTAVGAIAFILFNYSVGRGY